MIERPYCYEGCEYSPVTTHNGTLLKEGKIVCNKYPNGIPFALQDVNSDCPVANPQDDDEE